MIPDQYGRTGREWRFCQVCQRADALRMRKDEKGAAVIQCAYCKPLAKPAPAPQGIFA